MTVVNSTELRGVESQRPTLLSIVLPVLNDMQSGALQRALIEAFSEEEQSLTSVEQCFADLTARRQDAKALRYFFQSWSQTNNSAASVAGLSNRMSLAAADFADEA